jgi:nitroimidazol reductase NimA-like FMN-containing flavoprotein (pyridoxamine 5'-phosphate oxidase superfamily)
MRRNDKEIKDKDTIEWIIKEALICRIALCDNNKPYIVPMNFGFKDKCLYLHSANEGQKIDILGKNRNICFEVDIETELVKSENACNWGMKYYSIIGFGEANIIEEMSEKKKALGIIMQKYSENNTSSFEYSQSELDKIFVIKIKITEMTGKKSGY